MAGQPYTQYQPTLQPGWQRGLYGRAWGAALGLVKDYENARVKAGIKARWAIGSPLDAIGLVGQGRGMLQGPSEPLAGYIARILNAWGEWSVAGPWAILAQLAIAGYATAYVVDASGTIFGPSAGVLAPDPVNGLPGNPPAVLAPQTYPTAGGTADAWTATHAYAFGASVSPTAGGQWWIAGSAGTSGGSEPTWGAGGSGVTVSDGSVTWVYGGSLTRPAPFGWLIGSASGQGDPGDPLAGNATPAWNRFLVLFTAPPSGWTDIVNPPTQATSPTASEIAYLSTLIRRFSGAHAACGGITVLTNGTNVRSCWAWPQSPSALARGNLVAPGQVVSAAAPQSAYFWLPAQTIALPAVSGGLAVMISSAPNGHFYTSPAGGVTGNAEPSWPVTVGATVSDGTITWTTQAFCLDLNSYTGTVTFPLLS